MCNAGAPKDRKGLLMLPPCLNDKICVFFLGAATGYIISSLKFLKHRKSFFDFDSLKAQRPPSRLLVGS